MSIIAKNKFIKKLLYSLFLALALPCALASQVKQAKEPVVKFTFNGKSETDEISGRHIRLRETSFGEDRFGNPDNAVYLYGNDNSYINLGRDSIFKPKTGSFSVWFRVLHRVSSGSGYEINPIILTKNTTGDDFYESYGVNFLTANDHLALNCSRDPLKQIVIPSKKPIATYEWHHIVVSFDRSAIAFYLDGELQGKQIKNFETRYLPTDSVLLGVTANKKNNRFFMGLIDDIEFYDRVLDDEDVLSLYKAPNPNERRNMLNKIFFISGLLTALLAVYLLARFRISTHQKKERERLELMNKLLETELRVNRALMNPHFVYNSLYSIQSLILNREIDQANTYLVKFSRLLRKTLESNLSDTISLEAEIELLNQFIEIENLKFDGAIRGNISTDGFSSLSATYIPVLMIQPFVENAIWHGLKNKPGEKQINITFKAIHEKLLECTIDDNGLGRQAKNKASDGTENKSLATGFINARLALINKIYGLNCFLEITDKPGHAGTIVTIRIPVFDKEGGLKFYSVQ